MKLYTIILLTILSFSFSGCDFDTSGDQNLSQLPTVTDDAFDELASDTNDTLDEPELDTNSTTNRAPVAYDQTITVVENSQNNTIVLSGSDSDGDDLNYTLVTLPPLGGISLNGSIVTYESFTSAPATDTFTFKVNDGKVDSNTATVTITVVEATNTAPMVSAGTDKTVDAGVNITLVGTASDENNDMLTFQWTVLSQPATSSVTLNGATTLNLDFAANVAGTYSLLLNASDGVHDVNDSVNITVVDTTAPTVISYTPASGTELDVDSVMTFTLSEEVETTSLVNGIAMTDSASNSVSFLVGLGSNNTLVSITPDNNLTHSETYTVSFGTGITDLSGNTFTATTFTFTVTSGIITWVEVTAGQDNTYAIKSDGSLWAWGANYINQLGDGTNVQSFIPKQVGGGSYDWSKVCSGISHVVAIKTDGTLWSWGNNVDGQYGDGTQTRQTIPVQEQTKATDWVSCSAGNGHSVGKKSNNAIYSWGTNGQGELGDNTQTRSLIPVQESSSSSWDVFDAGLSHTVAITDGTSTLWAWGDNQYSQLGDGTQNDSLKPVQESQKSTNWKQVSAGNYHTIAVKSDDTLWAWGQNTFGQVGSGTYGSFDQTPKQVETAEWKTSCAGQEHSVAIKKLGTLWAWGTNEHGQLGDGTTVNQASPVQESTNSFHWESVVCGTRHTVALKTDGTLWTWGNNESGQLGDGSDNNSTSPKQVQ
jgi:alpha-tubulin suppressor-like RCC1 family protein